MQRDLEQEEAWLAQEEEAKVPEGVTFTLEALRRMIHHCLVNNAREVAGILVGRVEGPSVKVTSVREASTGGMISVSISPEVLAALTERLEEEGISDYIVGWYHSHPGIGCSMSGIDIRAHGKVLDLFSEAIAVIVDPKRIRHILGDSIRAYTIVERRPKQLSMTYFPPKRRTDLVLRRNSGKKNKMNSEAAVRGVDEIIVLPVRPRGIDPLMRSLALFLIMMILFLAIYLAIGRPAFNPETYITITNSTPYDQYTGNVTLLVYWVPSQRRESFKYEIMIRSPRAGWSKLKGKYSPSVEVEVCNLSLTGVDLDDSIIWINNMRNSFGGSRVIINESRISTLLTRGTPTNNISSGI